jgi:hypothetical protein
MDCFDERKRSKVGANQNKAERGRSRLARNRSASTFRKVPVSYAMTGDKSRALKVGDRVSWGDATTDLGTVTGTSWSEVSIAWDDGESGSVSHNDMARIERAAKST